MMNWYVLDRRNDGDEFSEKLAEGTTREEAIKAAALTWERLTESERERATIAAALAIEGEEFPTFTEWIEVYGYNVEYTYTDADGDEWTDVYSTITTSTQAAEAEARQERGDDIQITKTRQTVRI